MSRNLKDEYETTEAAKLKTKLEMVDVLDALDALEDTQPFLLEVPRKTGR